MVVSVQKFNGSVVDALKMEIENDELDVTINGQKFTFPLLEEQNMGNVYLATWECRAEFKDIELIERDTCEPLT
jgi:hypothetical protein